jgi:hypothetical protein
MSEALLITAAPLLLSFMKIGETTAGASACWGTVNSARISSSMLKLSLSVGKAPSLTSWAYWRNDPCIVWAKLAYCFVKGEVKVDSVGGRLLTNGD